MMLALADGRPAHLTRVHQALASLPEGEQRRLGVLADWKGRPHRLTYRQAEYTFGLVTPALGKDQPDGLPSPALQAACDDLLEASVPEEFKHASTLAGRGLERPGVLLPAPAARHQATAPTPRRPGGTARTTCCHDEDELFFGYYLSAADHGARTSRARRPRSSPAA